MKKSQDNARSSEQNDRARNTKAPQQTDATLTGDNTEKNPDDWVTGDEPMTGAQRSYLHTLASEAGEQIDDNISKAEASKKIDELQHKTGRGLDQ